MRDFDSEITEHLAVAQKHRGDAESGFVVLSRACARWASEWWADAAKNAVVSLGERAKSVPTESISELKAGLHALQERSDLLAIEWLAPLRTHDRPDADLVAMASRTHGMRDSIYVSLSDHRREEGPFRRLLGQIADPLTRSGLHDAATSPVSADGKARHAINPPGDVVDALSEYRETVVELVTALFQADEVQRAKIAAEATAIWDEA